MTAVLLFSFPQLDDIFKTADFDESEDLDVREFVNAMRLQNLRMPLEVALAKFAAADTNKDGRISKEEFIFVAKEAQRDKPKKSMLVNVDRLRKLYAELLAAFKAKKDATLFASECITHFGNLSVRRRL